MTTEKEQTLITQLEKIVAAGCIEINDEDFDLSDYIGNYDDMYQYGQQTGEYWLAKTLLDLITKKPEHNAPASTT